MSLIDAKLIKRTPCFRACLKTHMLNRTQNEYYKVLLDDISIFGSDNYGWFSLTDRRYTVQIAGFYWFTGQVFWSQVDDLTQAYVSIYKNGSEFCYNFVECYANDRNPGCPNVSGIIYLDVNDYVELWAMCATGSGADIIGYEETTFLSGFLVSPS